MTTNNSINSPVPTTIAKGGTANTSFTTYMPVCGGTTTTGALQSISISGASAGYVLTYVSSSALPTWQASGGSGLPTITSNYQILSSGTGTAAWLSRYLDDGTNLSVGTSAGSASISGTHNTSIGDLAGSSITSGSNNTLLGYASNVSSGTLTNATAIGYNASVNQSNALILGNGANVGIGTSTPNASSILDLTSTTQALLLPRLDQFSVSSPVVGMIIYDTRTSSFLAYGVSGWQPFGFYV